MLRSRFRSLAGSIGVLALLPAIAGPALAVDGVIEINQAKALAGGTGDSPGFPVVIREPGSYRLTSNLDLRDQPDAENLTAIYVNTSAALTTIDLNGFSILGPTECTGFPVTSCAPLGSGVGIDGTIGRVRVTNGMIRGMGGGGIERGEVVENVIAEMNGGDGIDTIVARNCRSRQNYGIGIDTPGGGEVTGSTAVSNRGNGIRATDKARITDNRAALNGGDGIHVGNDGRIQGNTVNQNAGVGIFARAGALVKDNVVRRNTGFALQGQATTAYSDNAFTGNNASAEIQVDGGMEIGTNLCGSDTVCP